MFLLNKLWGYLIGAGALIAVVLGALGLAKRAGKKEERAAETEKALQQSKESNEIDSDVNRLTRAQLDERMRKFKRD